MSCAEFLEGLLDYHFAVEKQEQREANRVHLRTCESCAQQYFDLKHDIDSGAAQNERPSEQAAARLRSEVTALYAPRLMARARTWLAAPAPRYSLGATMMAAAAAVALVLVYPILGPGRPPVVPQDEDRQEAQLSLPARHFESRQNVQQVRTMPASIVDSARIDALSITYY